MSKYPWDQAPEWAKFAATDEDGTKVWYEILPIWNPRRGEWDPLSGRWEIFSRDDPATSLEGRP